MSNNDSINIEDIKFTSGVLGARHQDVKYGNGLMVVRAYSLDHGGYHNTYCRPCQSMNADTIRACLENGTKAENVISMIEKLMPQKHA